MKIHSKIQIFDVLNTTILAIVLSIIFRIFFLNLSINSLDILSISIMSFVTVFVVRLLTPKVEI